MATLNMETNAAGMNAASTTSAPANSVGRVTQVLGAVVDVQFDGDVPAILNALHIRRS